MSSRTLVRENPIVEIAAVMKKTMIVTALARP